MQKVTRIHKPHAFFTSFFVFSADSHIYRTNAYKHNFTLDSLMYKARLVKHILEKFHSKSIFAPIDMKISLTSLKT